MKILISFFSIVLVVVFTNCSQAPSNLLPNNNYSPISWEKAMEILGNKKVYTPEESNGVYNCPLFGYSFNLRNNDVPIPYREETVQKCAELNLRDPINNDWRLFALHQEISINDMLKHALTGQLFYDSFTLFEVYELLIHKEFKEMFNSPPFNEPASSQCLLINMASVPLFKNYVDQRNNLKINHPDYKIATANDIFQVFVNFCLLRDKKQDTIKTEDKIVKFFTSSIIWPQGSRQLDIDIMAYLTLNFSKETIDLGVYYEPANFNYDPNNPNLKNLPKASLGVCLRPEK